MCDYFCRSSYSNYGQQCGAERIAEFEFGQLRDDLDLFFSVFNRFERFLTIQTLGQTLSKQYLGGWKSGHSCAGFLIHSHKRILLANFINHQKWTISWRIFCVVKLRTSRVNRDS